MKQRIYRFFTAGIFALIAMLTFSCNGLIETGDATSPKKKSNEKAYIILSVENEPARTVFAGDAALADMTYTIVGTKSGTTDVKTLASGMKYKSGKILCTDDANVEIDEGTWDFTLEASKGTASIYSGTVTNKVITSGANQLSFTLSEISDVEGNGTVSVTLKLSAGSNIAKAKAKLVKLDQTLVTDTEKEISVNNNSVTYKQDVKNGIYILQFNFYKSDNTEEKPGYSEVVQVKAGRTSEATRDISTIGKILFQNPSPTGTRQGDLKFIFNNQTLGITTITAYRSEWNQLLKNFDYFYKNENCVHGISYEYEKDGYKWTVPNVGFRLRGNTSRFRPQGKDYPTDKLGNKKMNADWSQDYYNYAANCSDDDYRQSHFKVDFEEWLEGDDEFKMAGCMKGVALKRMDDSCTREIMCYDLFHKFGIWTAPYASHTRLFLDFIEDDGTVTHVDFGVYEMFEEVNKQSLKARDTENNTETTYTNFWGNNKGNLWKISGGDLTDPNASMYVENNEITKWDAYGNPTAYVWEQPTYDLKTNKDAAGLEKAKAELQKFITDLNALPDNGDTQDNIDTIKEFYEKWFDMEFFLKTYAVNILVGMDDDYWGNANNYYLYFDTDKKGTGKVYFIPFDYDNTLGRSIKDGGFAHNPLDWGRGENRPLIDKLLLVPEYKELFIEKLIEVSDADGPWNFEDCSKQFLYWRAMVEPYLNSPDLKGYMSVKSWGDYDWNPGGNSLTNKSNNIYDATRDSFLLWLTEDIDTLTFDLDGGNFDGSEENKEIKSDLDRTKTLSELLSENFSITEEPKKAGNIFMGWTRTKGGEDYTNYPTAQMVYARWKAYSEIEDLFIYEIDNPTYDGIKIGILNVPYKVEHWYDWDTCKDVYTREIFVNGKCVSNNESYEEKDLNVLNATEWGFPCTKEDDVYEVYVKYSQNWSNSITSNTIKIKATSGKGELYTTNKPNFSVNNDIITFNPAPILSIEPFNDHFYVIDLRKTNWDYQEAYWGYDPSKSFDFMELVNRADEEQKAKSGDEMMFHLRYQYKDTDNPTYGAYWHVLYDFGKETYFHLKNNPTS